VIAILLGPLYASGPRFLFGWGARGDLRRYNKNGVFMIYRGHVQNGQIVLDEPANLPEGTQVTVELVSQDIEVTEPKTAHTGVRTFQPIEMPGPSLADELVRDRR
jgi:hypothetical protein